MFFWGRTDRGIELSDESLSFAAFRDAVYGSGHFLGHPQSMERDDPINRCCGFRSKAEKAVEHWPIKQYH
jgi:hypothetical protein